MNRQRMHRLTRNASDPAFAAAVERLRTGATFPMPFRYEIGSSERAEWSHYYYCPLDGARLVFEWSAPDSHQCPACGTVRRGAPYDGAWMTLAHERIGAAAREAAIYGVVANDADAVHRAESTLLAYARHYQGYELHGDIPYNGPGKLFAQTLDEAHWIVDLIYAYRFIAPRLDPSECETIRGGLLEPCARFLIAHKERQIHNHAMLITSAIAMLGFVLDDREIVRSGLQGAYGLYDQLARGVLEDGMWYEGNFHYHYYAFDSLLKYAVLAEDSEWDLREHPSLKRMFDLPLGFVLPNGLLPDVNDASFHKSLADLAPFYEVAYAWYGDDSYADLLRQAYSLEAPPPHSGFSSVRRDSFEALAFGRLLASSADGPGSLARLLASDTSSPVSGLTKLVNRKGWHLIVKHSPFGGEHDHMDQLGLSFSAGGTPLFVDPGTTSYAVPAHYGWFKHTYSHNTIAVNGQDQPPADGERVQYRRESWGTWVESRVAWTGGIETYRMRDAIRLPPEMCTWDAAAYRGVRIGRINLLTDEALLDIVRVAAPAGRDVDLLYHLSGTLEGGREDEWNKREERLCALSPEWMDERRWLAHGDISTFRWRMRKGLLLQAGWCSRSADTYLARTPDNPPVDYRRTWIRRAGSMEGQEIVFVNAFAYRSHNDTPPSAGTLALEAHEEAAGQLRIRIGTDNGERVWRLDWNGERASLRLINEEVDEGCNDRSHA